MPAVGGRTVCSDLERVRERERAVYIQLAFGRCQKEHMLQKNK